MWPWSNYSNLRKYCYQQPGALLPTCLLPTQQIHICPSTPHRTNCYSNNKCTKSPSHPPVIALFPSWSYSSGCVKKATGGWGVVQCPNNSLISTDWSEQQPRWSCNILFPLLENLLDFSLIIMEMFQDFVSKHEWWSLMDNISRFLDKVQTESYDSSKALTKLLVIGHT